MSPLNYYNSFKFESLIFREFYSNTESWLMYRVIRSIDLIAIGNRIKITFEKTDVIILL